MTAQRHDGTPRVVAHLRLPQDLHAELTAYAQQTQRSLNGAAVFLLKQAMRSLADPSPTR